MPNHENAAANSLCPTFEYLSANTLAACAVIARSAPDVWSAETLEKAMNSPHRLCPVALLGDTAAAFACFRLADGSADLEMLAVEPSLRGRGVGAAMLSHGLALIKELRISRCLLEVRASNQTALDLYRRLGFTVLATRPGMYAAPRENGLLMAKRL